MILLNNINSIDSRRFWSALSEMDNYQYLQYGIAYNIAPTLYGIKPATLINISRDRRDSYNLWESNKERMCQLLKINYYELKKTEDNIFILFYNEGELLKLLKEERIKNFLIDYGYKGAEISDILYTLSNNYKHGCPDEIGIFLGIPYEDVRGYIENSGENFMICSYWKVYSNLERANQLFKCYEYTKNLVASSIFCSRLSNIKR